MISAAPATLLTTLPMMTGVDVAGPSSDPDVASDEDVLEDAAPEAVPDPLPAMKAPSLTLVDVAVGSNVDVRG
jgi:hypothetical protein